MTNAYQPAPQAAGTGTWPAGTAGYGTSGTARPCYACGRDWGAGIACQFCRQVGGLPSGIHITSAGKRFGGYLLEGVLLVFTAVIGWLVWALVVFKNGQTPAKQVLGMRCVSTRSNRSATWGTMALRELIAKPVIGVLSSVTLGIVNFWLVWDANTQELWDKMAGTIVVNDPQGVLQPGAGASAPRQESPPPAPIAPAVGTAETGVAEAVAAPALTAKRTPAPAPAKRAKAAPAKRSRSTPAKSAAPTAGSAAVPAKRAAGKQVTKRATTAKKAVTAKQASPRPAAKATKRTTKSSSPRRSSSS